MIERAAGAGEDRTAAVNNAAASGPSSAPRPPSPTTAHPPARCRHPYAWRRQHRFHVVSSCSSPKSALINFLGFRGEPVLHDSKAPRLATRYMLRAIYAGETWWVKRLQQYIGQREPSTIIVCYCTAVNCWTPSLHDDTLATESPNRTSSPFYLCFLHTTKQKSFKARAAYIPRRENRSGK